jgi:hypothetical protein
MDEGDSANVVISDSPQEMSIKLTEMKQKINLVQRFFKEVMIQNQDYGVIQGTDKPTLLKPGAEKLCELYGYVPTIKHIEEKHNREIGFYYARVTLALIHKSTGYLAAEGVGEANTMEGRYRWRWVPQWKLQEGIDISSLYSEERKSKNGTIYRMYRLENEDPWILWNTVLKMAKKRALIDATLSATSSSGIFTQDVEDLKEWISSAEIEENIAAAVKNIHTSRNEISITQAQAKRMFVLAKGQDEIVRDVLNRYGYERSIDVLKSDYDEICSNIEQSSANVKLQ